MIDLSTGPLTRRAVVAVAGTVICTESGCVQTALPLVRSKRFIVTFSRCRSTSTSR
jgi:hypothetical protein